MIIEKMLIKELEDRFVGTDSMYDIEDLSDIENGVLIEIETSKKLIDTSRRSELSELEKEIVEITKRRLKVLKVIAVIIDKKLDQKIITDLGESFQL